MSVTTDARRRRTWWVVGTLGVLTMTAVIVWFAVAATSGKVHWTNTGFLVDSEEQVTVRFDLVRDPGRAVVCELHALDENKTRIGTAQVEVGPVESSPSRHTAPVRTVTRATTGYVDFCWYADERPATGP
ncbi:DUF4307 domain-containing protein [Ornithinicoccus halotolerans]|uniref:DUF4307 domain-containing protein n=1 Tax=Ornithinicoccus halotolerans TaxID=1748220 RepID=UPI001296EFF0|nr:DUF4307 domain-containing protein [Ornithinicoccus halotolerans]